MRAVLFVLVSVACVCALIFAGSSAGDLPANEIRKQVDQLRRQGQVVSAWHFAIRSWQDADFKYGSKNSYTAELLIIVAEMAKYLKKYDLAAELYERALEAQSGLLGREAPEVAQSRAALADLQRSHRK
jgi:hypothetical protein